MKRSVRFLALVLLLVMGLSGSAVAAYEGDEISPQANAYIDYCYAAVSKSGDYLRVSYTVGCSGIMTSLGASSVKIYTSGGTPVKTFWSASNPSMLGSGRTTYSSSVYYDEWVSGTSYYAVVKFYATDSTTGSGSETYTTGTITM